MRLRGLALACLVAVSSAALLASGASAFAHPDPSGRCRVGIDVVHHTITTGESVVIFGRLTCSRPADAAGKPVKLFRHLRGVPGFTYVQSTTTDAQGYYQFQDPEGAITTNRTWYVRAHRAESANRGVRVAAQVTLSGPAEGTQILTGKANSVTFTGTVNPADEGAQVILQRQNALTGNEWRRIDAGTVTASGAFTIVHTFIVPGDANIRVLVRSQRRNIPSSSNVLAYEISQTQNPALTIDASADPIPFGQSVTIGGTLTGGANEPVTLLARSIHQRGFAPVAQATTEADGNYAFPAQTPMNSTFYRVQASSASCASTPPTPTPAPAPPASPACGARPIKSAVLYEGVRDLLSAQASPTTLPEGQTVTFSGSVAPNHAGDTIYLQRQDAYGPGFHVVSLGTIGNESTFSIPYQVYSTGTQVFRVYIPGGPENEGVASQTFAIQVTPAPATALAPEAPGGSTLPAEGEVSTAG
jgi:hypothetical protein